MTHKLPIETPSLTLRPFVPEDAPKLFLMHQEDDVRTWLRSEVYRDEAHAASVLDHLISQYDLAASPETIPLVLGVEHKPTRRLIGHVGLSPIFDTAEVGFAIERAEQRKGYATEAVRAMCRWGLQSFSLQGILGITDPRNVASQRVLLRSGFCLKEQRAMRFQGVEQPVLIFEHASQSA